MATHSSSFCLEAAKSGVPAWRDGKRSSTKTYFGLPSRKKRMQKTPASLGSLVTKHNRISSGRAAATDSADNK
eukprot:scaffold18771_cov129-Isochrysis_galbana.AAC.2